MSWHRIVSHRRPASKRNALNAKQRAELLRRQVDTVGRPGQPGGRIRNVISVGMLSEGWDAKTVTHIMGLARLHLEVSPGAMHRPPRRDAGAQ